MVNAYGSLLKSWVWGNKAFKISWTFKQHRAFGGLPKRYAGIDIACPVGTKLYAPEAGIVYRSSRSLTDGAEIICLKHKSRLTEYVHLSKRLVGKGARIKKDQLIGLSGKSGKVTGAHLHFALINGTIYDNSKRIDPYNYLLSVSAPISAQVLPKAEPAVVSPKKVAEPKPQEPAEPVKPKEGDEKMPESKRFTLNSKDAKSIAVGALLAIGGSLVAYFSDLLPQIDWGKWAYLAIPVSSILINAVRKFLEEEK